jgi:hypothetical protein
MPLPAPRCDNTPSIELGGNRWQGVGSTSANVRDRLCVIGSTSCGILADSLQGRSRAFASALQSGCAVRIAEPCAGLPNGAVGFPPNPCSCRPCLIPNPVRADS